MANFFENTPKYMKWTAGTKLRAAFWGLAVPYALWKLLLPAYVRTLKGSNRAQLMLTKATILISKFTFCKSSFLLTPLTSAG